MSLNKETTRYYSSNHENSIAKAINGKVQVNSGGTKFYKGDVVQKNASLLIEAKCSMSNKTSFSIKKEWIEKNRQEAFSMGLNNSALCFTFEPNGKNYYIIDEKTMKFLVEKLEEIENEY